MSPRAPVPLSHRLLSSHTHRPFFAYPTFFPLALFPHSSRVAPGWLEAAFQRLVCCAASLGASHPGFTAAVRHTNLETGAEDDVPPDSFWAEVAAGMRLTPAQVGAAAEGRGPL